MIRLLRQPYPYDNQRERQRTALVFGLFVAAFLYIFQPFGFHNLAGDRKLWHALAYGGVTWGLMALRFALQRWYGERFGWTQGLELLVDTMNVVLIAAGNLLVGQWLSDVFLTPVAYWYMLAYTFAIGLLPVTGLVLYIYNRTLRQQVAAAAQVQRALQPTPVPMPVLQPPAAGVHLQLAGKETVSVAPDDLLAATAAENYVNLMYRERGVLRQKLLRGTLAQLEAALAANPQFVRTHRAWVVNLDAVQRVAGNAQGYLLTVEGLPQPVPVARRMTDAFEAALVRLGRTAPSGMNGRQAAEHPDS